MSSYAFKEPKKYASTSINSCKMYIPQNIFLQELVQWKLVSVNLPAIIYLYKINNRLPQIVPVFLSLSTGKFRLRSKDSFLNRFVYVVQARKYNVYYISKVVVQGQTKELP